MPTHCLELTGELVEKSYCPLVFPEGQRSPNGELQPFRGGIGLMALRQRLPVVPIHLTGLFEVLSPQDSWPRRGVVDMKIGPAQRFGGGQSSEEITKEVEKAIINLE